MTPADPLYGLLRLWDDANRDGIAQTEELTQLSSRGVVSISTDFKSDGHRDPVGNVLAQRAKIGWLQPSGAVVHGFVYDIWLATMP